MPAGVSSTVRQSTLTTLLLLQNMCLSVLPADAGHYGIAPIDQGHFISLLQPLSVLSLQEDVRPVEHIFSTHRRVFRVLLCGATVLLHLGEVHGDSALTGEGNIARSHRINHLRGREMGRWWRPTSRLVCVQGETKPFF